VIGDLRFVIFTIADFAAALSLKFLARKRPEKCLCVLVVTAVRPNSPPRHKDNKITMRVNEFELTLSLDAE
jgi:hypothetical protein